MRAIEPGMVLETKSGALVEVVSAMSQIFKIRLIRKSRSNKPGLRLGLMQEKFISHKQMYDLVLRGERIRGTKR